MRRFAAVTFLTLLVAVSSMAAVNALRLEGIAYTEGAAKEIQVQVWALGEQVADHPEWQFEAVFDGVVSPGKAFAVELGEARLPVLIELEAEGHSAVSLQVVFPEQLRLPPAWLRRGEPLTISVSRLKGASDAAVVWGEVASDFSSNDPRFWRTAIAHRRVAPGASVAAVVPPGADFAAVLGVHPQGHFGKEEVRLAGKRATGRLELSTIELPVKVWDHRGRPVAGVRVIEAGSPFEAAAVTDEEGQVVVRVPVEGQWKVVALDDEMTGTFTGRGRPDGEVAVDLEERADLTVTWAEAAGPLAVLADWLPRSLGGTFRIFTGGRAMLPKPDARSQCRYWSPSVVSGWEHFDDAVEAVVLKTRSAVRLDGRVVTTEGAPVAGIPVWVRLDRRSYWRYAGMSGQRSAEPPLDRPWLPWAVSGADGSFSVAGLPPSDVQAEALAPGLPTARGERLTGKEGQRLETTVVLRAGATLALRVTDPGGAPLEAAAVDVYRSRETRPPRDGRMIVASSRDRGDPELSGATDAEGRAVLRQVPVGLVRLRLSRPGSVTRTFDGIVVPAEGADLGDLVLEPGVTLHGTTVGPDGDPVANAEVATGASPRMPYFRPETTSDGEGRFSIADLAASGAVYLQARADGFVPSSPLEVRMPPENEVEVAMAEERKLEGVVLDRRDDAPVAGARLVLSAYQTFGGGSMMTYANRIADTETDTSGRFVLDGLAGGSKLELAVTASGLQRTAREVVVPADADSEPLVIRLEQGLELRGRVLDENGEAASGARVAAAPASQTFEFVSSSPYSTTAAGADGRFLFDDLAPGTVTVQARSENGRTARATAEPGQTDDVVLRFKRGLTITGIVLDAEGSPVVGADVSVYGECADNYARYETAADGRFELRVAKVGRCRLGARVEGHASTDREIEVPEGGLRHLELRLERGATVPGQVVGVSSAELERCLVYSDDGASTRPGADGSFRLSGVGPGERRIIATLGSSERRRSVRASVLEAGEAEPVVIDFDSGLTLTGRVLRGGSGEPGLTVTASGVSSRVSSSGLSGADGAWRIEGLEPGEYQVAARTPSGEVVAGDHVLLEADAELDLHVVGGRIAGRVVASETNQPIEGATVTISGSGLPPVDRRASTDASGFFEALDLADGDYIVRADAVKRSPAQRAVRVEGGIAAELTIALSSERTTVFVVRGPDGRPPTRIGIVTASGGIVGPLLQIQCSDGGRCEVNDLPAGRWTVAIGADGVALMVVDLPRDEVAVTLRRSGRIKLRGLADEGGPAWQVRLVEAATAIVYPVHQWYNPGRGEWVPVGASGITLDLPEGGWRIDAVAPDGTRSVYEATVTPGGTTEVILNENSEP